MSKGSITPQEKGDGDQEERQTNELVAELKSDDGSEYALTEAEINKPPTNPFAEAELKKEDSIDNSEQYHQKDDKSGKIFANLVRSELGIIINFAIARIFNVSKCLYYLNHKNEKPNKSIFDYSKNSGSGLNSVIQKDKLDKELISKIIFLEKKLDELINSPDENPEFPKGSEEKIKTEIKNIAAFYKGKAQKPHNEIDRIKSEIISCSNIDLKDNLKIYSAITDIIHNLSNLTRRKTSYINEPFEKETTNVPPTSLKPINQTNEQRKVSPTGGLCC